MKFGNLSVVIGTTACNAGCSFCVADQICNTNLPKTKYNLINLEKACRIVQQSEVFTALLTGRGEPTLFPNQITEVLPIVNKYFPIIELQTNAMLDKNIFNGIATWIKNGLTTVCISCISYEHEANKQIYGNDYQDLIELANKFKSHGMTNLRITCVGLNGFIDSSEKIMELIYFCKSNGYTQCTWRPVWYKDDIVSHPYSISKDRILKIKEDFDNFSINQPNIELPHGATIYDIYGQNFCLANCMTRTNNCNEIRQLIVYPEGKITYDWQYEGFRIL